MNLILYQYEPVFSRRAGQSGWAFQEETAKGDGQRYSLVP